MVGNGTPQLCSVVDVCVASWLLVLLFVYVLITSHVLITPSLLHCTILINFSLAQYVDKWV